MLPIADIAASLKARWRLELLVFVVALLAVATWTLLSPKIYDASSSLLFEGPAVDPVQGTSISQDNIAALLVTQSDVIKSDAVASDVVRNLQLATPEVVERWQAATGGSGNVDDWYAHQLDPATTPVLPASPNVPLRMFLGSVLGVLLAAGAGLAMETWRPRVRTSGGVASSTSVPVLASIDLSSSAAGTLLKVASR